MGNVPLRFLLRLSNFLLTMGRLRGDSEKFVGVISGVGKSRSESVPIPRLGMRGYWGVGQPERRGEEGSVAVRDKGERG